LFSKFYDMKKIILYSLILILSLSACEKDKVTQLSFTLKNLTTLLGKSTDHVTKASPGEIYINSQDYIYFRMEEVISGMTNTYLFYSFENNKCKYILVLSEDFNILDDAETFLNLAEVEIGEAQGYYLAYWDDMSELQEEEFTSLTALWAFVTDTGITVDKISELIGLYFYNDFYFLAGGFHDEDSEDFHSMIQIGRKEDMSGKKNMLMDELRRPFDLVF